MVSFVGHVVSKENMQRTSWLVRQCSSTNWLIARKALVCNSALESTKSLPKCPFMHKALFLRNSQFIIVNNLFWKLSFGENQGPLSFGVTEISSFVQVRDSGCTGPLSFVHGYTETKMM